MRPSNRPMPPSNRKLSQLPLLLATLALLGALPAFGATITVTNLNDSGAGSLRDAIASAASGDTINFSVAGTITLTTGFLEISKNLTINGPGAASLTVSGNNTTLVFLIDSGQTATISGLTITGGHFPEGGGIVNDDGTLTLNSSTISGNSGASLGGGIYNVGGTLTLNSSTVSGNSVAVFGGGIFNDGGTLTLTSSAISGNSASEGGGIYNDIGTLTLTSSTVSGNSGGTLGGGIFNDGGTLTPNSSTISDNSAFEGGGIFNVGTLTLNSSTISGNSGASLGGGIYSDGTLTLNSSTVSANSGGSEGGGVYDEVGGASVVNTIIAGNTAGLGPDAYNVASAFTDNGNNFIGETDGSIGFTAGTTLTGTVAMPLDPLLAPLGSYGGTTQTMMLLAGSPALNKGSNTGAPANDQRGLTRIVGGTIDIGAVEFQGATLTATAGTPQSAGVGAAFATNLQLTAAETGTSNPLNNVGVTFTAPASGASGTFPGLAGATSATTNSSGIATASAFTADAQFGDYFVTASVTTLSAVAGVQTGSAVSPGFSLTNIAPLSTISLSTSALSFTEAMGATVPAQTFAITNTGAGTLVWTAAATYINGSNWLTLSSPAATGSTTFGIGDATVSVSVDSLHLSPGSYTATVTVSSLNATDSPQFVSVMLTVTAAPAPTITSFTPTSGPVGTQVTITGTNFAGTTSVKFDGTASTSFTVASVSSITATVPPGAATGTITVTTPSGTATSAIQFVVTPPLPVVSNNGIVNGASFALGTNPLAPGTIATIFGSSLDDGSSNPSASFGPDGKLPLTLGGASVTFNGIPAPLFAAFPGQLTVEVPWELAGSASASVQVTVAGQSSVPRDVQIAPYSPGIFAINNQGTGQGAVLIANTSTFAAPVGSILGAQAQPASSGQFITIYTIGLGAVSNQPATGQPGSSNPLSQTTVKPQVTIGGVPATVSFYGLAPGFAGLYQVNVQVPAGAPTGSAVQLTLSIGGAAANPVTIALQ